MLEEKGGKTAQISRTKRARMTRGVKENILLALCVEYPRLNEELQKLKGKDFLEMYVKLAKLVVPAAKEIVLSDVPIITDEAELNAKIKRLSEVIDLSK